MPTTISNAPSDGFSGAVLFARDRQSLLEDYVRLMRQRGVQYLRSAHEREREVLQLLAEGKSNKEAATVEREPIHGREPPDEPDAETGLHNTAEIVLYAVRKRSLLHKAAGGASPIDNQRCTLYTIARQTHVRIHPPLIPWDCSYLPCSPCSPRTACQRKAGV